jgi:DNA-binding Lrp family transcriptional regulator
MVDDIDRQILIVTGEGLPLTSEPFRDIAEKLKIKQEDVIFRLKKLIKEGFVRRFGALVNHRKVGLIANAMVVWRVPQERIEEVGMILSGFNEITHCYQRKTIPGRWEYNLYTVVHGYSYEEVELMIKKLSETVNINDYLTLFSIKEFKKTSFTPYK